MKKIITLPLLAFFALSACATDIMQGYVGKSVQEPILDYGPPTNVVELDDGRRGYQWQMNSSGVIPMSTPTSSTVFSGGQMAVVNSTSTTYLPYSQDCLYTLTAVKQGDIYIVDGFRQPSFDCL